MEVGVSASPGSFPTVSPPPAALRPECCIARKPLTSHAVRHHGALSPHPRCRCMVAHDGVHRGNADPRMARQGHRRRRRRWRAAAEPEPVPRRSPQHERRPQQRSQLAQRDIFWGVGVGIGIGFGFGRGGPLAWRRRVASPGRLDLEPRRQPPERGRQGVRGLWWWIQPYLLIESIISFAVVRVSAPESSSSWRSLFLLPFPPSP